MGENAMVHPNRMDLEYCCEMAALLAQACKDNNETLEGVPGADEV